MKSLPSSFLPSFVISFLSFSYSYLYRATQTDTTCVYEKGRGLVSEWERTSGRPRRGPNPPDFKAGTFFVLSDITNTHSLSLSLPLSFFLSLSPPPSLSLSLSQCSPSTFGAQKLNQKMCSVVVWSKAKLPNTCCPRFVDDVDGSSRNSR